MFDNRIRSSDAHSDAHSDPHSDAPSWVVTGAYRTAEVQPRDVCLARLPQNPRKIVACDFGPHFVCTVMSEDVGELANPRPR
jgi:hypothetical protein